MVAEKHKSKPSQPILRLDELEWSVSAESAPVFRDFNLEIFPGERCILKGPSGSGKTSILRCIVHLEKPDCGTIYWRGEAVLPDTIRRFRRNVIYLQQRPSAVGDTIGEELEFARRMGESVSGLDESEQKQLLSRFGLSNIDLSQSFESLSVGEKQRVSIIRALTLSPDVLLLDEPTSALDLDRAKVVEEYLVEYIDAAPDSRSYLWVTHSEDQIDRIGERVVSIGEADHE